MKHFLPACLVVAASCLSANASINSTGNFFSANPRFIPKGMTYDNKALLYIGESDETEFTILNDEFNEVSKFSTPTYPEVTAKYTIAYSIDGPTGVYVASTESYDWWIGEGESTKENFAAQCVQSGYTNIETRGNETWYLSEDTYFYYYSEVFGKKYPTRVYVWNNLTNKGEEREIQYAYESWGPTGAYGTPRDASDSASPLPLYIYPWDPSCYETESFVITQTLFNNDENFEWIVPIIEAVDCSYTNEYQKVEGKRLEGTGFRVESQNGSVIATVKYPAGLYGSYYQDGPSLYIMNNKKYLFFELHNIDHKEYYFLAYELDTTNGSVNAIAAPRQIKVAPTQPQRGTDVNITFDNPTGSNCKVIVTSVSGKVVFAQNVQPGVTSAAINTAHFEKGLYIVSVSTDGVTRENTKIVVR